jgi:hypothetical protein
LASNTIEKDIGFEAKYKELDRRDLAEGKQRGKRGRPKARQLIEELRNIKQ